MIVKCLQKVVIEVSMKDAKARSKALKIVVGVSGKEIHTEFSP